MLALVTAIANQLMCVVEFGRRWQSRDLAVMLLGGPGGALLPGVQTGALGCFGTAVQEREFSRADVQQVRGQACRTTALIH